MSRPRRPRLRFMESAESATSCSSLSTNCGITRVPSRKPVSQMSAIRPSMITLVSRMRYRFKGPVFRNRLTRRPGSSHSPLRAPIRIPRYGNTRRMKLWRNTTRRSLASAQNSAAPIVFASPRPTAPPISAPSRSVTSASRRRVSTHTIRTPRPAPIRRLTSALELKGPARTAAYVTAATKRARARRNHAMYECLANRPRGRCPRRIKRSDHEHHTRERRASREARRTYSSASTESGSLAITHGIEEANNYQQIR